VTLIYHSLFASKSKHPTIPEGHNSLAGEARDGTTLTDEFIALMTGLAVAGIIPSATLASDQEASRARAAARHAKPATSARIAAN
jgi:hypothetical protein